MIYDASIEILKEKELHLSLEILSDAFEMDGYDDIEYQELCKYIASKQFIVWMVQRENIYEQLRYVIGPEDPNDAKEKYPQSIRAYYGLDKKQNALYFSPSEYIYNHQVGIFFFHDDNDNDAMNEIPNVPDKKEVKKHNQTKQETHDSDLEIDDDVDDEEEEDDDDDDEYALILVSSAITTDESLFKQIKTRITSHKFVIIDESPSYLAPDIIQEMFNDGYSTFGRNADIQFQELLTISMMERSWLCIFVDKMVICCCDNYELN